MYQSLYAYINRKIITNNILNYWKSILYYIEKKKINWYLPLKYRALNLKSQLIYYKFYIKIINKLILQTNNSFDF